MQFSIFMHLSTICLHEKNILPTEIICILCSFFLLYCTRNQSLIRLLMLSSGLKEVLLRPVLKSLSNIEATEPGNVGATLKEHQLSTGKKVWGLKTVPIKYPIDLSSYLKHFAYCISIFTRGLATDWLTGILDIKTASTGFGFGPLIFSGMWQFSGSGCTNSARDLKYSTSQQNTS